MLLPEKIESSETKYKSKLEEFFIEIYDVLLLPSHGIDHHKRVWYYAVEILNQLNDHPDPVIQWFFAELKNELSE